MNAAGVTGYVGVLERHGRWWGTTRPGAEAFHQITKAARLIWIGRVSG